MTMEDQALLTLKMEEKKFSPSALVGLSFVVFTEEMKFSPIFELYQVLKEIRQLKTQIILLSTGKFIFSLDIFFIICLSSTLWVPNGVGYNQEAANITK